VAGGDAGDQGLGAVPAGHPDDVGPAGNGLLGQLAQVVARGQDHRVDPAPPGLLDQVEALDLAAARLGVHQQDRPGRRAHRLPGGRAALQRPDVPPKGVLGRHPAGHGQPGHRGQHQHAADRVDREHD
jgi:hypothetical protein